MARVVSQSFVTMIECVAYEAVQNRSIVAQAAAK